MGCQARARVRAVAGGGGGRAGGGGAAVRVHGRPGAADRGGGGAGGGGGHRGGGGGGGGGAVLRGRAGGAEAPQLPGMSPVELGAADLWATGLSGDSHPVQFARERLAELGAVAADGLAGVPPGTRVLVGGVVTHRQRPATAGGTTFLNLEDETGLVNVICSRGGWAGYRRWGRPGAAPARRGRLERAEG